MANPWRTLRVKPNHENKVAAHLAGRGVEHFLPTYTEESQWTDRKAQIRRPLFPGYLFVRFDPSQRSMVISTPGTIEDSVGPEIPSDEIERIRAVQESAYPIGPHERLANGMYVRINQGAFAGAEGIVEDMSEECLVVITITNFAQCFSVRVLLEHVDVVTNSVSVKDPVQLL